MPPQDFVIQQMLELFTERPELSEKDLQFAIASILNGNGHNGHGRQNNGRLVDSNHRQQQEFFDRQPPELQEFMLQTALLPQPEKLARFCNALLKIDNSEVHLQAMADNNLLGDPAFTEFLRHKVKQDEAAYQELCLKTAHTLHLFKRWKQAIGLYAEAQEWPEVAQLLEVYGNELFDAGQALELYEWLNKMNEETEQRPRLLILKGRILNDYFWKPKKALMIFEQVEQVLKRQNNLVGVTEAQAWQSVSFRLMGEGAKSLELALGASAQLDTLLYSMVPKNIMALVLRCKGLAYSTVGQVSEALADLQESLSLFEESANTYYVAMCHHDLGVCFEKLAKLDKAEYHHEKAVRIWRRLKNQYEMANTLNSLGSLFYLAGRYDEALEKFNECFQIAAEIKAPRRQSFALAGMADVYRKSQTYQKAINTYRQSTEFAQKANAQWLQAYNLLKTGEALLNQNHLEKALKFTKQSAEIAENNGLATEYGKALTLWGRISMRRGLPSPDLFEEALKHLGNDALGRTEVRLWFANGLLFHDLRPTLAYEELIRAIPTLRDNKLASTIAAPLPLLTHFFYRADTPARVAHNLEGLLKNLKSLETGGPDWQFFAFGQPRLIVGNTGYEFKNKRVIGRTPEFLSYFILEIRGQEKRSKPTCQTLWPSLDSKKARRRFSQTFDKLRADFGLSGRIVRNGHYYRLAGDYWCDVLAFEQLFERASTMSPDEALPLRREILALYQGDFLANYELEEWGEAYRADLRQKYLQTVELVKGAKQ